MPLTSLLSLLLLLFSVGCSTLSTQKNCLVHRASVDLGSGATRLRVSKINHCNNTELKLLVEKSIKIDFLEHIQVNKNLIGASFSKQAVEKLKKLLSQAESYKVDKIVVGAAGAFRKAFNAQDFLNQVKKINEKIKLFLLDQKLEARVGYHSVNSELTNSENGVIVWDVGGSSMQLIRKNKSNEFIYYFPEIASILFKNELLKIQGKTMKMSPNPISSLDFKLAKKQLRNNFSKTVFFENALKNSKKLKVIGIGGVHNYSILAQVQKSFPLQKDSYSLAQIKESLVKRLGLRDSDIKSDYRQTEISNLIMISVLMEIWGVDSVNLFKSNLTKGLLFL